MRSTLEELLGDPLFTAKEVAAWLGVTPNVVHKRVKDGSLRASRIAPTRKGLRFKPDDVRAFVARVRV